MTFSELVGRTVETEKKSSRQGNQILQLLIHHTAGGTNDFAIEFLSKGAKKVSATYTLLTTGELVGIVPEEYRPWTTGWAADKTAITVETVNSSGAPDWAVTDEQVEKLAQLAADLSIRYEWGELTEDNVNGHREFDATVCPGPYLWPRLPQIVERANEIRNEILNPAPVPEPTPDQEQDLGWINDLVDEIIAGHWGNGKDRKEKLRKAGFNDEQIQSIQNQVDIKMRRNPPPPPVPTPPKKNDLTWVNKLIEEIIAGKWGNGEERRSRLRAAGFTEAQITSIQNQVSLRMGKRPSLRSIANEVIQGKWGNGQDRVNRLRAAGYDPAVIQREVRAILKSQ